MKVLIVSFIAGNIFVYAFYIIFPLVLEGSLIKFDSDVVSAMIRQGLISGIVFGLVFYLISLISQHNKRKRELDDAMRKYFESHTKEDK